jgi:uncharacterized protein YndB with AHSA1/START domain
MTKTTERDGRLEQVCDRWQIQFTRSLAHSPEKVWRALTDPEHRKAWFPDTSIGDFTTAGAKLRFEIGGTTLDGEVFAADPPKLLELSWGDDILRFELRPDGAGTVLDFSAAILEVGKGARDTAGWHVCIDRLESALDGTLPDANPNWRALNDMYVERFGPEASTLGPPEGHPEA